MSLSEFVRCNECRTLNESRSLFCSRCGASLYGHTPGGGLRKRRRITAAGAVMAVALLLVLAATVFALYAVVQYALQSDDDAISYVGQAGTTATIGTTTTESDPSSNASTTTTVAGTLVRPTAVTASSSLKATSTNNYRPTNLLDGDTTTAWNEGAEGPGLGEWIKVDFSQQLTLSRIDIANGYQKDEYRFTGNPRIKSLQVEYSNGTTQLITLLDTQEFQSITPTRQPVEWVKLTIISVYPGEEWDDTALSEVRIYAGAD